MFIWLLLFIVILFIYNVSGIYLVIPFILAIINYIYSSINLLTNNQNFILRLIQLISLGFIIIILLLNIKLLILKLFI